jgi:arsenate reductase|tara:strand:- start:127 stop:411 length:285 start_codon:yes stop_codon:yes gene_type:complete
LRDNGYEPNIIEYLKNPPNVNELNEICKNLNMSAIDITRTNEKEYKQLNIPMNDTDDVLIEKIARHPKLLERPIVIKGKKGIIGRPPENVLKLL